MQTDRPVPETGTEPQAGLTETVHTSPPDISAKDVARLMTSRGIGSVVVVNGDKKPIGIVTDRDIVVRVTAPGLTAADVTVEAVMSSPLLTIAQEQDIDAAVGIMARYGIRRLPIVDEAGYLVSILTLDDLLRLNLASTSHLTQIVREQAQPLPPEPGARVEPNRMPTSASPAAAKSSGVLDTNLPFKPGVTPDDEAERPSTSRRSARKVAAVAKKSVVVPMIKRRRRIAMFESAKFWVSAHRIWTAVLVGLALLLLFSFAVP